MPHQGVEPTHIPFLGCAVSKHTENFFFLFWSPIFRCKADSVFLVHYATMPGSLLLWFVVVGVLVLLGAGVFFFFRCIF